MLPVAPARFSTTTVCPSRGPSSSAAMRPVMSVVPAGGNGTTKRIVRDGHASCARGTAGGGGRAPPPQGRGGGAAGDAGGAGGGEGPNKGDRPRRPRFRGGGEGGRGEQRRARPEQPPAGKYDHAGHSTLAPLRCATSCHLRRSTAR